MFLKLNARQGLKFLERETIVTNNLIINITLGITTLYISNFYNSVHGRRHINNCILFCYQNKIGEQNHTRIDPVSHTNAK